MFLLFALAFGLSHKEYITLLPKSITTVIGMGVAEEFGGIVAITVAVIIITGILGNIIAITVFRVLGYTNRLPEVYLWEEHLMPLVLQKAMEMGEIEGSVSSLASDCKWDTDFDWSLCICQLYQNKTKKLQKVNSFLKNK